MTTTVKRADLLDALKALRPVAGTNPTLPVLANVLIDDDGGGSLSLITTNLDVFGRRFVPFEGESLRNVTVPVKAFTDFLAGFSGDTVTLRREENRLRLTCGRQRASLSIIEATEFPSFPTVTGGATSFSLTRDEWDANVLRVAGFAAKDIARPILTGVSVKGDGQKIRFAAADNYRVGVTTVDHQAKVECVIPASTLSLVTKVCIGDEIQVATDGRVVEFAGDMGTLISRLVEGQFPNIESVLPSNQPVSILVGRDELTAAARLALIGNDMLTKFEATDEGLRLSSKEFDKDFEATVSATVGGESEQPIEVALKTTFVTDTLNVLGDATEVELLWSGKLAPIEFRDPADPTFRAVIMPVRTSN